MMLPGIIPATKKMIDRQEIRRMKKLLSILLTISLMLSAAGVFAEAPQGTPPGEPPEGFNGGTPPGDPP